jgi:hypothetical protein
VTSSPGRTNRSRWVRENAGEVPQQHSPRFLRRRGKDVVLSCRMECRLSISPSCCASHMYREGKAKAR